MIALTTPFDLTAGWLYEHAVLPLLYQLGLMQWEETGYGWTLFAVYGLAQVLATYAVCLPLERWRPVERWPDRRAVTVGSGKTTAKRKEPLRSKGSPVAAAG